MFEPMNYVVRRIDGDYAYLELEGNPEEELKCVARLCCLKKLRKAVR